MSRYQVIVTPISDRVLPPLFWSGPFTSRTDAVANVAFWLRLGFCSARLETIR